MQVVATATTTPDNESNFCQKKHLSAAATLLVVVALVATSAVFMTLYLGTSSSEDLGRAENITNFINSIKLSEGTLVVPSSKNVEFFTNEQEALAWVIYHDPLQLLPNNDTSRFRLQQRYAVLTLLMRYPMFPQEFNTGGHECYWRQIVSCNGDSVTKIYDVKNYLYFNPGTLSSDLGLLTSLTTLDLSYSRTSGSLHDAFAQWTNLEFIDLSDNDQIVGTIPALIATAWSNLKHIDLSTNSLTESLPASIGAAWTNVEFFDVSYNAMTGTIPSTLNNWKNVSHASFENNSLVGSMPNRFCGDQMWKFERLVADCEVRCLCCSGCYKDATGNFTPREV